MVEEDEDEEPGTSKKSKKWVTDHFKIVTLEVVSSILTVITWNIHFIVIFVTEKSVGVWKKKKRVVI